VNLQVNLINFANFAKLNGPSLIDPNSTKDQPITMTDYARINTGVVPQFPNFPLFSTLPINCQDGFLCFLSMSPIF
jgi:hypothetical protein